MIKNESEDHVGNVKEIDCQEIKDYRMLYQMFGDEEYKTLADNKELEMKKLVEKIVDEADKYIILNNSIQENNIGGVITHYCTLFIVEERQKTIDKIWSILNDLGEIEWVVYNKFFPGNLRIKIKDGYTLIMYDYTGGVV